MATTDCTQDYMDTAATFNAVDIANAVTTNATSTAMGVQLQQNALQQQNAYTTYTNGTSTGSASVFAGATFGGWSAIGNTNAIWDEEIAPPTTKSNKPRGLDDIIGEEVRRLRG